MQQVLLAVTKNRQQLERQLDKVIEDIKATIYPQARVAIQSNDKLIELRYGGPSRMLLPSEFRIIELHEVDVLANFPYYRPGTLRGLYDYSSGKIFLCKGRWCLKTLIHEALHSVSFFAVRPDLRRKLLSLNEGITELFTGYVLFRRYADCYKAWKLGKYEVCSVVKFGYLSSVKLFAGFCRFIPLKELTRIYFWDGTTDWEKRYNQLLKAIHRAGYSQFKDILQRGKLTVELRLLQECKKAFGKKFDKIYFEPLEHLFDFNKMLL